MNIKIKSDLINGLALAKMDKKYGYLNSLGQIAIPFIYKKALPFSEGLAAVKMKGFTEGWNYINIYGQRVIGGDYIEAKSFKQGRAAVIGRQISKTWSRDKFGWGFIDYQGNRIVDCCYDLVNDFNEGFSWIKVKALNEWHLFDWNGNLIFTLPNEEQSSELFTIFGLTVSGFNEPFISRIGIVKNGWAEIVVNNKKGMVGINGQIYL